MTDDLSHESERDTRTAEQLDAQRPVPPPGFRGALRRHLVASDPGYGPRPPALRATVSAYLATAVIVFVIAVLIAVRAL